VLEIDVVIERTAEHFKMYPKEITGRSRERESVYARYGVIWLLRQLYPSISVTRLGRAIGGRDHTTIMYAEKRVLVMREEEDWYAATLDGLLASLRDELGIPERDENLAHTNEERPQEERPQAAHRRRNKAAPRCNEAAAPARSASPGTLRVRFVRRVHAA